MSGESVTTSFPDFKTAATCLIVTGDQEAAFLWDRIGHWAQVEGDWSQAEDAYRKAYALQPETYGYCLGTALNFLGRYTEALSILLPQAEMHKSDAQSWFQVAKAREGVGDIAGAIAAYHRAVELDPDYELAIFNLGGTHWNSGNHAEAVRIWCAAVTRFPGHAQTAILRQKLPFFFRIGGDDGNSNASFLGEKKSDILDL